MSYLFKRYNKHLFHIYFIGMNTRAYSTGADLGGVTRVTSHPPPLARQPISCYYYNSCIKAIYTFLIMPTS